MNDNFRRELANAISAIAVSIDPKITPQFFANELETFIEKYVVKEAKARSKGTPMSDNNLRSAARALCDAVMRTLDRDFAFWSANDTARLEVYSAWTDLNKVLKVDQLSKSFGPSDEAEAEAEALEEFKKVMKELNLELQSLISKLKNLTA